MQAVVSTISNRIDAKAKVDDQLLCLIWIRVERKSIESGEGGMRRYKCLAGGAFGRKVEVT